MDGGSAAWSASIDHRMGSAGRASGRGGHWRRGSAHAGRARRTVGPWPPTSPWTWAGRSWRPDWSPSTGRCSSVVTGRRTPRIPGPGWKRWSGRCWPRRAPRRVQSVGVGCGGPMTRGGELVSPLNIPGWRDFPLRARLGALTGLPVAVDNDAKALALGEGWCGAAQGWSSYLAMVVSTGVGWRHRAGRTPAARSDGQRRAHRPHGRRARWPGLRVRGPGLPGGRGVRPGHPGRHRPAAAGGSAGRPRSAPAAWSGGPWPTSASCST